MAKTNMEYWKMALDNLPESFRKWFEREDSFILDNVKDNSKVLDVGCGNGRHLNLVFEKARELVGIDHDEKAVEMARNNFEDRAKVNILLADGKNIPFEDNYFDIVFCLGTFVNLASDRIKVLKEIKRVTQEKGHILISSYSEDALDERLKLYYDCYKMKKGSEIKEIKGNGTVIFDESMGDNISEQFSEKQLRDIFNQAELNVVEIKKFGIGYDCKLREEK